jgi:SAM-dependent methyltransferase
MQFRPEVIDAVDAAIEALSDVDLAPTEEAKSDSTAGVYLRRHRHEYLRTVQDVFLQRPNDPAKPARVLEIGSFFGVVVVALKRLGYRVTAADIPECIELPPIRRRFEELGVEARAVRLEEFRLPFEDEAYDVVVMCEVLEHLNFNPLPLIKDINRILSVGGLFYLSLPNVSSFTNRMRVLKGEPIMVTVNQFFKQLDPLEAEIANGHWKEYTADEVREILTRLGFSIARQYYFSLGECLDDASMRKRLGRAFYRTFPALKENQTTLALKARRTEVEFSIPRTVHPTLGRF